MLKSLSLNVERERGEDTNNRVFGAGDMIDYGGVAFARQDDTYSPQSAPPKHLHPPS